MQSQKWRQEDVDPIPETNQVVRDEKSDPTERDSGEQLEAAAEQAWGEGQSHGAKVDELSAIG